MRSIIQRVCGLLHLHLHSGLESRETRACMQLRGRLGPGRGPAAAPAGRPAPDSEDLGGPCRCLQLTPMRRATRAAPPLGARYSCCWACRHPQARCENNALRGG